MKGTFLGTKMAHTLESKKQISLASKRFWDGLSVEERKKIANKISESLKKSGHLPPSRKGMKWSEESKRKFTGRKLSKEHRKKLSERRMGRFKGKDNPAYIDGLSHTKEANRRYASLYKTRIHGNGGSFTLGEWELLKKQYGYRCPCCWRCEPEIKLSIDHIIPIVRGGNSNIENIQPLCFSCNVKKHTKIIKYKNGTN